MVLRSSFPITSLLRYSDLHTSAKVAVLSTVINTVGDIHRAWRREPSDLTEGGKGRPEQ